MVSTYTALIHHLYSGTIRALPGYQALSHFCLQNTGKKKNKKKREAARFQHAATLEFQRSSSRGDSAETLWQLVAWRPVLLLVTSGQPGLKTNVYMRTTRPEELDSHMNNSVQNAARLSAAGSHGSHGGRTPGSTGSSQPCISLSC